MRASKRTLAAVAVLCLLGLGLVLFRCTPRARSVQPAQKMLSNRAALTFANPGNAEWEIRASSYSNAAMLQWRIRKGATVEVELEAGSYRVEQRLLASEFGPAQVRFLNFTVEAGKRYRWQLANLLSSDAAELELPVNAGGTP